MKPRIKQRVITPDGPGVVVGKDLPDSSACRYLVLLDVKKYNFLPAYFPKDLKKE